MKRTGVLLPALLLFLIGCAQEGQSPPNRKTPPTSSTEATSEQKEAYRQQVREELDRLEAEWNKMKARAAAASDEVRARMQPTIDALQKETEAARGKLQDLQQNTAEAWRAARPELERAMGSLRDAFRKAAEQFK